MIEGSGCANPVAAHRSNFRSTAPCEAGLRLSHGTVIRLPDRAAMNGDARWQTKVPIPAIATIATIVVPMAIVVPIVAAKDLVIAPAETETDEPAEPGFREKTAFGSS
jgi:hypothetical protein